MRSSFLRDRSRRLSRIVRGVIAGTFVAASLPLVAVLVPSTPASADSGFCGVRVSGPADIPDHLIWAYTWRNKCNFKVSEKLYFGSTGRYSGCFVGIAPSAYTTAFVGTDDSNWSIVNC
jgi:hypothetical protein